MSRIEELETLKNNLAAKIKTLPVAQRKQAVKVYQLFIGIIESEKAEEQTYDLFFEKYEQELEKINLESFKIIEGQKATDASELAFWKNSVDTNYTVPEKADTPEPIPKFWYNFLTNAGAYTGEQDEQILVHLTSVRSKKENKKEEDKEINIETSIFTFSENQFFKNKELTIKCTFENDEPVKSEGTKIDWILNPTIKKETKKSRHKKTGEVKTITKEIQLASFFELFDDYEAEDEEEEEPEDDDGEMKCDIHAVAETVTTISTSLPHALEYFLGIDDGEEIEDEDEEEEESEEEDEKPEKKPRKKSSKRLDDDDDSDIARHPGKQRKTSAGDKTAQKPADCKQQ